MADSPQDDKYIRTFAKDVALMKGEPLPPEGSSGVASEQNDSISGDRDAVLERLRARAANDPVTEGQLLPDTLPTPVAIPENKDAPFEPPPPIVSETEETQLPTYQPQAPVPTVYREEIPDTSRVENAEPALPVPTVIQPVIQAYAPEEGPSPLHTYSTDFADKIDANNSSTFSVLAAQSDAQTGRVNAPKESRRSYRGVLITVAGVFLLAAAAGGGYAVYRYVAQKSFVPIVETVPSLVFADEREALTSEGADLQTAMLSSLSKPLDEGKVRIFYLTEASSSPERGAFTITLPGGRLLGALQLNAPDILLRNVAPESTVGAVHAGSDTRVFFILRVLSYERTFAGMLSWEPDMASQLSAFYPGYALPAPPSPTIATTTTIVKGKRVVATTTVDAILPPYTPPHFVDEVASNHNVRALKDMYGNTILLYGYKDKETLIIARDEPAFAELINRLSATKQQ